MIWDTLIWRLECSNRSKIRSAQKCNPCLRYELSPMSPGRTLKLMVGLGGLEPPTSPLSGARSSHLSYRPVWNGLCNLNTPPWFLLTSTLQPLTCSKLLHKTHVRHRPALWSFLDGPELGFIAA